MSARRSAAVALGLFLLAPALVGAASDGLRVRATGPAWTNGSGTLWVALASPPAVPGITVMVFGGDRLLARQTIPAAGGRLSYSAAGLSPGRHELTIKSGTAEGRTTVRVLPGWFGPLAALLLMVALLASARLSSRAGTG